MCPPRAGTSVLQRPRPHRRMLCACPGVLLDAYAAWVLFVVFSRVRPRRCPSAHAGANTRAGPAHPRGPNEHLQRASCGRKKIHQSKRVFPGQFFSSVRIAMAKGSKTKPNYRPKVIATNLDNIPIPVERKRGKGHTARPLPRHMRALYRFLRRHPCIGLALDPVRGGRPRAQPVVFVVARTECE